MVGMPRPRAGVPRAGVPRAGVPRAVEGLRGLAGARMPPTDGAGASEEEGGGGGGKGRGNVVCFVCSASTWRCLLPLNESFSQEWDPMRFTPCCDWWCCTPEKGQHGFM